MIAANKLANVRRRAERARQFALNTCPASRHVHIMADAIAAGRQYHPLTDEPEYCAESLYSVLESLWKARMELAKLKGKK